MKRNFIRSMKKPIRKMQRKKRNWRQKQRNRRCVKQRKVQRRKRADRQHRRDSIRQEKQLLEQKGKEPKRKQRILAGIKVLLHSSQSLTMRWDGMVSAGYRTSFIPRPSAFMTSIISWHRMRIRTLSLKTGVTS